MTIPVLTAVTDAVWEADLVRAFESGDLGVTVVRRCVDLADLLATAATGAAQAAILSADLRRLDREALTRLAVAGVAVIGLVPTGDEAAERRLRQLGVGHVLPAGTPADLVGGAVVTAVTTAPGTDHPLYQPPEPEDRAEPEFDAVGRIVAVWGPTGAPGRTMIATGLATELAGLGVDTLLVDADPYGGTVAQVLGLLDDAPGIAAATRLANGGLLDVPALAELARAVTERLRVLTGLSRADRWPELRPASLDVVLALARRLCTMTIIDTGFCLEEDEELSFDQAVARRNGATLTALHAADVIVAVGGADPVGLQRLVRGLADLADVVPGPKPWVVVNRVRASAMPGRPEAEIGVALARYAGVTPVAFVPLDIAACDAALARGVTLAEAAPRSPARAALRRLAGDVAADRTADVAADLARLPSAAAPPRRRWARTVRRG